MAVLLQAEREDQDAYAVQSHQRAKDPKNNGDRAGICHEMKRRPDSKYGMVTMCIGVGMGAAGIFEYVCGRVVRASACGPRPQADMRSPSLRYIYMQRG